MGTFETTNESIEFVKDCFKEYYKQNKINLPDRFSRREYAFVIFGKKGMIRHLGFDKKSAFEEFISKNIPFHAYYSSAYYQIPDAPTMNEKKWMGAELIFDLDSDHLPDAEKLSYEEQLSKVKDEFIKLVKDFLIQDFGFQKKYIELFFSGGRGYHCHIKDPEIFELDSNERREIVDYITGRDLRDTSFFHEQVTSTAKIGERKVPTSKSLEMPTPDEPGWRGRISRGIIDIVNEIKKSDSPVEKLKEYGVKQKDAERLLKDLSNERVQRIKEGKLDQSKVIRKFFLNSALRKTAVAMSAGETDEPVTCDVKRLIRLPGSLHGKTGFKVSDIRIEKLEQFEPLEETIVLNDELVKVRLNQDFKILLKNQEYKMHKGEQKIPIFLAVFLIGRKIANIT
jgi:DNA primase small subunit